ncbi:MAG: hypothetical protein IKC03_02605 [Oscillospiraceae bacterium]|nr:hypothetical protein [Oscillospiraceae bacterium]
MGNNKSKHTIWIDDDLWELQKEHYKKDNCGTQNEFIEKALCFYIGHLHAEHTEQYLPRVLSSTLEGHLSVFADRVAKLMYKQAVELDMVTNLIAAIYNLPSEELDELRKKSVRDVNRTNGKINFDHAMKFQRGEIDD